MKRKKHCLQRQVAKVKHKLLACKLLRFLLWFSIWLILTTFKNGGKVPISDFTELVLKIVEDGLINVY